MKESKLFLTVCITMLLAILTVHLNAQTWTGLGTNTDPYEITNAQDLADLANLVNMGNSYSGKHFILVNDIPDLTNYPAFHSVLGWEPIGTSTNPFSGNFDGNNKTIRNLWIDRPSGYVGLFGKIDGAVIKDLGVEIDDPAGVKGGGDYVGGFVGYLNQSTITNCYTIGGPVEQTMFTTEGIVGGFIGALYDGASGGSTIKNCYSECEVNRIRICGRFCRRYYQLYRDC